MEDFSVKEGCRFTQWSAGFSWSQTSTYYWEIHSWLEEVLVVFEVNSLPPWMTYLF